MTSARIENTASDATSRTGHGNGSARIANAGSDAATTRARAELRGNGRRRAVQRDVHEERERGLADHGCDRAALRTRCGNEDPARDRHDDERAAVRPGERRLAPQREQPELPRLADEDRDQRERLNLEHRCCAAVLVAAEERIRNGARATMASTKTMPAASATSVIRCRPNRSRSLSSRPATDRSGSADESTSNGSEKSTAKTWNDVAYKPVSSFDESSDVMIIRTRK